MKKRRWWDHFLYFLSQGPPETEPIPKLSVVTIQKGDTILLTFPNGHRVSRDHARHLVDHVQQKLGDDCKVLILDGGIEVGIVRRGVE